MMMRRVLQKRLLTDFENGEIGEIYLIYTFFKNTVSHIPTMIKVLPAEVQEEAGEEDAKAQLTPMNFEPEAEEAISLLVPKYISKAFCMAHLWKQLPVRTVHVCRRWIRQPAMRKR